MATYHARGAHRVALVYKDSPRGTVRKYYALRSDGKVLTSTATRRESYGNQLVQGSKTIVKFKDPADNKMSLARFYEVFSTDKGWTRSSH